MVDAPVRPHTLTMPESRPGLVCFGHWTELFVFYLQQYLAYDQSTVYGLSYYRVSRRRWSVAYPRIASEESPCYAAMQISFFMKVNIACMHRYPRHDKRLRLCLSHIFLEFV